MSDWSLQTMYIQSNITVIPVKRKRPENPTSKRSFTRKYFFPIQNEGKVEVCKNYFKHTLRISDQRIANALDKETVVDKRGKHEPHNKL